jgi:hypothetical protein
MPVNIQVAAWFQPTIDRPCGEWQLLYEKVLKVTSAEGVDLCDLWFFTDKSYNRIITTPAVQTRLAVAAAVAAGADPKTVAPVFLPTSEIAEPVINDPVFLGACSTRRMAAITVPTTTGN